jgi:hypothetical protein
MNRDRDDGAPLCRVPPARRLAAFTGRRVRASSRAFGAKMRQRAGGCGAREVSPAGGPMGRMAVRLGGVGVRTNAVRRVDVVDPLTDWGHALALLIGVGCRPYARSVAERAAWGRVPRSRRRARAAWRVRPPDQVPCTESLDKTLTPYQAFFRRVPGDGAPSARGARDVTLAYPHRAVEPRPPPGRRTAMARTPPPPHPLPHLCAEGARRKARPAGPHAVQRRFPQHREPPHPRRAPPSAHPRARGPAPAAPATRG